MDLTEVINIGVGWAASIFNDMIDTHINLQIPSVKILDYIEAQKAIAEQLDSHKVSSVRLGFTGTLKGNAQLIFPVKSASKLLSVVTHEPEGSPDLDSLKIGTLTEIGNILINGVIGSISNLMEQQFNYSLPTYFEGESDNLLDFNKNQSNAKILLAKTVFSIEELKIKGGFIIIFYLGSFDLLIKALEQGITIT